MFALTGTGLCLASFDWLVRAHLCATHKTINILLYTQKAMRKELAKMEDVRTVFTGVFVRFGEKNGYKDPIPTVLLKNVCDESGKMVTDHLWLNLTKGFATLDLKGGETVEFRARVREYVKGYKGRDWVRAMDAPLEEDYKLSRPTKIRVIAGSGSTSPT